MKIMVVVHDNDHGDDHDDGGAVGLDDEHMDGEGGHGGDQSPDFTGRQKPQDAILECLQGMQSIFLFERISSACMA